jgi:hypothetical protein
MLNAFRRNVRRHEADAVDLVILVAKHVGVVGAQSIQSALLIRSPAAASTHGWTILSFSSPTGTFLKTRLNISGARSTDSSIAGLMWCQRKSAVEFRRCE